MMVNKMHSIASYQEGYQDGYTDGAASNVKMYHEAIRDLKRAREMRDKYHNVLKRNAPESYYRIRQRNKDNWES